MISLSVILRFACLHVQLYLRRDNTLIISTDVFASGKRWAREYKWRDDTDISRVVKISRNLLQGSSNAHAHAAKRIFSTLCTYIHSGRLI